MSLALLDQETLTLLGPIVERQAFRQLMAGNIRGHGIQLLPDVQAKGRMARDLQFSLKVMDEVERIHAELGGSDLVSMIRPRIDRVPLPNTRLELSICLALLGASERAATASYLTCCHEGFAAVARMLHKAECTECEADARVFIEACTHPIHRSAAQEYWERWLVISLQSLGRPGSQADERAVALGLRSLPAASVVRLFLDDVEPLRVACGLTMPPMESFGTELPEDLRSRFTGGGLHG